MAKPSETLSGATSSTFKVSVDPAMVGLLSALSVKDRPKVVRYLESQAELQAAAAGAKAAKKTL